MANSRPHKKTPSVWRRRKCVACGTVFTTNEVVSDSTYVFQIKSPDGKSQAFSLPQLMFSIATSLSHRPAQKMPDDSYWLAQTVAMNIQATATDKVSSKALAHEVLTTLSNFDATAGIQYGARHGLVHNTAQKPRRGRPRTTRRGLS
ncbi:MAG: hypothetical protein ABIR46_01870 [Candidatus Saccharimonadales bacterium]